MPLWGRGAGSPSNTMWPGPRPTCVPSFILISLTVWPQCTNITDRQDRTDRTDRQTGNGLIAQGEPFYKRSPKNGGQNNELLTGRYTVQCTAGCTIMYTLRVHHEAYVTCTLYSYLHKQNKFNNPQPTQSPPITAVRDKSDAFSMYVTVHTEILPVKLYKQIRICSFITLFSERELTFTFAICYRPSVLSSVCRLSVCRL